MDNRPSFSTTVGEAGRTYTRDILRYDLEEDDDELGDEIEQEEVRPEADPTLEEQGADEVELTDEQ